MSVHNVTWYATASGLGSTEVIEGALNWLTGGNAEISREKVGIGTTGALILRVDKKGRETVTGFLPGFDADTGQVTSSKTGVVSYQSKYMK